MPVAGCGSLRTVITALWWRLTGLEAQQQAETRIESQEMAMDSTILALVDSLRPALSTHRFPLTESSRSTRCWCTHTFPLTKNKYQHKHAHADTHHCTHRQIKALPCERTGMFCESNPYAAGDGRAQCKSQCFALSISQQDNPL